MRVAPFLAHFSWLCLLTVLAAGCDTGTDVRVPVRGKVCFQGVPLASGLIVFSPDPARGGGPLAQAEVRADGAYDLRTEDGAGAVPGWYRVTVVALQAQMPTPGQPFAVPISLLPDKYRDPELSGLVREVKAGRDNRIDFNLE